MNRGTDQDPGTLAAIRDLVTGEDEGHTSSSFVRGLTLGALIGAAIAGSAIWQRRSRRPAPADELPGEATPPDEGPRT